MALPQNSATIFAYLVAHGATPVAAAGILGNIQQESGGNPLACEGGNCSGSGYGLIQWTPGSKYFSSFPSSESEALSQQLPMVVQYINDNGGFGPLNSQTTPAAAATVFCNQYERPDPAYANLANRTSTASAVYNAWLGGTLGTGTTPSGTVTPSSSSPGAIQPGSSGNTAPGVNPSGTTNLCILPLPLNTCLLRESQVRKVLGGLLMAAGGVIALVGLNIATKGTAVGRATHQTLGMPKRAGRAALSFAGPEGRAASTASKGSGMNSSKAKEMDARTSGLRSENKRRWAEEGRKDEAARWGPSGKGADMNLGAPKASTEKERKKSIEDVNTAFRGLSK